MAVKEIKNIFSKEKTLTDTLLSILNQNEEYSIYIHQFIGDITKTEDAENE